MWAVSALIFLANPLIGGVLLLSAAVTQYVRVRQVDAEYAKRGELPPTARLVEAWLSRQKKAGKAPANATVKPYGSRAYAKQRWQAFWEDLGDKHRADREAHKQAVAEAKKNGTPPPARPPAKDRLKGWKWAVNKLTRLAGDKPNTDTPATAAVADPDPKPDADGPIITCDECGARLADTNGGYQHPDGSTCTKSHLAPKPQQTPATPGQTGASPPAGVAQTRSERGSSQPVRDPDQKTEGEPMATTTAVQQSGEVTGIPSAINYLTQMANVHQQHADNEALAARLAGFRIGDTDLALVQAAMTASRDAAELYRAAADALEKSNAAVREAYASAPDAADKHAQVTE